jgi:hypothetical protein
MEGTRLITMIRTAEEKAVIFLGSESGQYFDLRSDPAEVRNLWRAPEVQPRIAALTARMLEWRLDTGLAAMDRAAETR